MSILDRDGDTQSFDLFLAVSKLREDNERYRAALDRITKHPDCHRLIMQIACEALDLPLPPFEGEDHPWCGDDPRKQGE